eukprot:1147595-Pelagomonas_calceolata.AAC.21
MDGSASPPVTCQTACACGQQLHLWFSLRLTVLGSARSLLLAEGQAKMIWEAIYCAAYLEPSPRDGHAMEMQQGAGP